MLVVGVLGNGALRECEMRPAPPYVAARRLSNRAKLASPGPYATIDGMLIPRYSLRWLLVLITVAGGVSLVLSYAFPPRNRDWAIGIAAALGCLVVLMLLYALAFLAAWAVAQVETSISKSRGGEGSSPFASDAPASPFGPPAAGLPGTSDSPPPLTG